MSNDGGNIPKKNKNIYLVFGFVVLSYTRNFISKQSIPLQIKPGKMKPIRWTSHALQKMALREIDRSEAEKTLHEPQFSVPADTPRMILMRRYYDILLHQEMLLRIVVEESDTERIVITVYKTSQIDYYLKGLIP